MRSRTGCEHQQTATTSSEVVAVFAADTKMS
jgi:hypothetical protein